MHAAEPIMITNMSMLTTPVISSTKKAMLTIESCSIRASKGFTPVPRGLMNDDPVNFEFHFLGLKINIIFDPVTNLDWIIVFDGTVFNHAKCPPRERGVHEHLGVMINEIINRHVFEYIECSGDSISPDDIIEGKIPVRPGDVVIPTFPSRGAMTSMSCARVVDFPSNIENIDGTMKLPGSIPLVIYSDSLSNLQELASFLTPIYVARLIASF